MLLSHFAAFRPHCPRCAAVGRGTPALELARVLDGDAAAVRQGVLHCPEPACQHEYPIVEGIPLIVPDLRRLLAERGVELLLRDDLDPVLDGLLGDAIGPESWFEAIRQTLSTYAWDSYADLDPAEPEGGPLPGAARRCLARLLALNGDIAPPALVLEAGCGAGRTAFDLAERFPAALVLGCDLNLALLRLAQRMARVGSARYPRRRVGLVHDQRTVAARLPGRERVDFWACDAAALPFAPASLGLVAGLNLLDCVADPSALLLRLAGVLRPDGTLLLATPFDWATRATPVEAWLGGHSQRGPHAGAAEPMFYAQLAAAGLTERGCDADWPWHTRLHDRAHVAYRALLVAAGRA